RLLGILRQYAFGFQPPCERRNQHRRSPHRHPATPAVPQQFCIASWSARVVVRKARRNNESRQRGTGQNCSHRKSLLVGYSFTRCLHFNLPTFLPTNGSNAGVRVVSAVNRALGVTHSRLRFPSGAIANFAVPRSPAASCWSGSVQSAAVVSIRSIAHAHETWNHTSPEGLAS